MPHSVDRADRGGEGANAAARLDDAREDEKRAQARQDSARGTPGDLAAATDLHEASEQVAAREAWVKWVERDY